jgi:ketosteroid isomerase-like protein
MRCSDDKGRETLSAKENKALIRRYFEAIDRPNATADILDEFLDPEIVTHNPPPGVTPNFEGLKKQFAVFQKSTPGYHTIDLLIAEGDKVAAWFSLRRAAPACALVTD